MQLGALLPLGDIGGEPAVVREYAQTAEAIGYHFIEAPDHVLGATEASAPEPGRTGAGLYHDPFVLFGFLAGCTNKLGFSTEALVRRTGLHVKGFRTPASQWRDEMLGGRRPKSLRGGNRGEVSAGSGVGLWRFSLCMPRSLDIERGSRPSNHRGVGFGRRVQDRNGGLVVSDLRFGGRRRD